MSVADLFLMSEGSNFLTLKGNFDSIFWIISTPCCCCCWSDSVASSEDEDGGEDEEEEDGGGNASEGEVKDLAERGLDVAEEE